MLKTAGTFTVIAFFTATLCAEPNGNFKLKDAGTTIKIAKAVLEQELGAKELRRMKSFEAVLKGDKWVVYLHPYGPGEGPHHGGSFDIEIAVEHASILSITPEM